MTIPTVELIYDADCPNVESARVQLRRAFAEAGQPAQWREWDRGSPSSPPYVRDYGSPTILVGGKDVAGSGPSSNANCCRLYRSQCGFQGVPEVDTIAAALRAPAGDGKVTAGGLRSWLAILPAIGVAMLPKLACPACWPAYAGLLSALGLGFLIEGRYLFPLTVAFLAVAVAALGFRAKGRNGYGPFVVGALAAATVVIGKFQFESDFTIYAGLAVLIGASIWNTWPKRKTTGCPACAEANAGR